MDETFVIQGRRITPEDIDQIRELIAGNPHWSRWRLSKVVSAEWNWLNGNGQLKVKVGEGVASYVINPRP